MCFLCCCCPSGGTCTYIAAIVTGAEAACMAILNFLLILACSCNIKPSQSDQLETNFMEKVWSWFIIDNDKCVEKDSSYVNPPWFVALPISFLNANSYDLVEQPNNYSYQIIYFIVNLFWFASAFLLFFGNAKRYFNYYIPWLILCATSIVLDTILGSFYIRFMDELNPGWEDGQAIFAMQFLYYRGFVLYAYNVIAFFIVLFTCWEMYRQYRRDKKLLKKATKAARSTVTIVTPPPQQHHHNQRYYQHNLIAPDLPQRLEVDQLQRRAPAPSKYRPFSYTNPAFRPNDPHDIEGMKMNPAVDPYTRGYTNNGYDDIEQMGTKIPRISLIRDR